MSGNGKVAAPVADVSVDTAEARAAHIVRGQPCSTALYCMLAVLHQGDTARGAASAKVPCVSACSGIHTKHLSYNSSEITTA